MSPKQEGSPTSEVSKGTIENIYFESELFFAKGNQDT